MNGSNLRERAHRLHNGEDSGGGPGSQRRNSRDIIVGDLWDQMIATMLLLMMLLRFRSPPFAALLLPRKHVYMYRSMMWYKRGRGGCGYVSLVSPPNVLLMYLELRYLTRCLERYLTRYLEPNVP